MSPGALGREFVDDADFVGRQTDQVRGRGWQAAAGLPSRSRLGRCLQNPFLDKRDDRRQLFIVAVVRRRHRPRMRAISSGSAVAAGQ